MQKHKARNQMRFHTASANCDRLRGFETSALQHEHRSFGRDETKISA